MNDNERRVLTRVSNEEIDFADMPGWKFPCVCDENCEACRAPEHRRRRISERGGRCVECRRVARLEFAASLRVPR